MYSYGFSVLFIYILRQFQTIRAKYVNCSLPWETENGCMEQNSEIN